MKYAIALLVLFELGGAAVLAQPDSTPTVTRQTGRRCRTARATPLETSPPAAAVQAPPQTPRGLFPETATTEPLVTPSLLAKGVPEYAAKAASSWW